jgi:general secretion pathway protein L
VSVKRDGPEWIARLRNSPSLIAIRESVAGAFRWWLDTLTGSLPQRFRQCCRQRRQLMVLRLSPDNAVLLDDVETGAAARREPVDDPAHLDAAARLLLPQDTERLEAAMEVQADAVLHRNVTWPLETEGNLDRALRFQLDKLIPFPPDAVFFGYRIRHRDRQAKHLNFDFVAVPKSVLEPWLQALDASPLGPHLSAIWAEPTGRAVNLLPRESRRFDRRSGVAVRKVLALVIGVLLVAAVSLGFVGQQRELALLDDAIAGAMKRAERTRALDEKVERKAALLRRLADIDRRQPHHAAVMAELARILPDSAYLQRMTLDGSRVTVIGQAQSSVALVDALSESPWFRDVEFVSKVTRDARTGRERFQLRMEATTPP